MLSLYNDWEEKKLYSLVCAYNNISNNKKRGLSSVLLEMKIHQSFNYIVGGFYVFKIYLVFYNMLSDLLTGKKRVSNIFFNIQFLIIDSNLIKITES